MTERKVCSQNVYHRKAFIVHWNLKAQGNFFHSGNIEKTALSHSALQQSMNKYEQDECQTFIFLPFLKKTILQKEIQPLL